MNLKEYISSGILESYALGLTDEKESREVREMAKKHPEISLELEEIFAALENYARAHSKEPPRGLRDKVIKKLCNPAEDQPKVVHIKAKDNKKYQLAAVAAIALLIVSAGLNLILYSNWQDSTERVNELISQQEEIMLENQQMQNKYMTLARQLDIINSPENVILKMKGSDAAPQSMATVFWNKDTKRVFLNINDLPRAPAGKQYQLWCLHNGKPVSMGVFQVNNNRDFKKMDRIKKADGFAVTLEEAGGSRKPTFDRLYLRCASWASYYDNI